FAVIFLALTSVLSAEPQEREEPQPVESLWLYDYGSPTTYREFIAEHPYRPFHREHQYSSPMEIGISFLDIHDKTKDAGRKFGIFVNTTLYEQITDSITQYISDLEFSGWQVVFYTTEGGTPQEVKALIEQEYRQGMVGCILIGDIPIAWLENEQGAGNGWQIDLYYGDMDGTWADNDGNGLFDQHDAGNGDRAPEIWLTRLYASTLDGDEAELMKNYFRKNHAYREGSLTLPRRALDYIDDDWSSNGAALDYLYDDVTSVNDNQLTIAEDYKQRLSEGYSLIRLWAHSGNNSHGFKDTPDQAVAYTHCYVHSPLSQEAQLRLGSDDGAKVWLNGTNVCTYDIDRGHQFDANTVDVSLKEGWNRLLVKVADQHGTYGFSARLSDADGGNLPNLKYQLNNPEILGTDAPFIRSWLINGFYSKDDNWYVCLDNDYLGGEDTIDALEGEVSGDYAWKKIDSSGAYIDLNAAYSEFENIDAGISYAYARIHSPRTQTVELLLGGDDGMKVWLNGRIVHTVSEVRDWKADENRVEVILNSGWNKLLIKTNKWYGSHGFSARFSHPDGTEVQGLRYDPAAEAVGYIRDWLYNGWYKNPGNENRLSEDYLGTENTVMPSNGDNDGGNEWAVHYSVEDYIDFNERVFSRSGGNINHEDVISIDPDCFFYDLWCCGTRMCYNPNYLGGWYIFTNSYGLASWGLLYPTNTFYRTLGEGKCLGEAQLAYMEQAVTEDSYGWAEEFGMYGDPTLTLAIPPTLYIIYVDDNATGKNDGTSWTNAYNYLQDALALAFSGDEIRVAKGLYKPDEGYGIIPADRTATFQLKTGVTIKGGYAGLDAYNLSGTPVDPNTRYPEKFETILSGDIGIPNINSENSYHVVTGGRRISRISVLDGFTITAGNADGNSPDDQGAGMYINQESFPTLTNCIFIENSANHGAGIHNGRDSGPTLTNCKFMDNSANRGAAMYNGAYSEPILKLCTFGGNSATEGGAIYNYFSTPRLTNCIFSANTANWGGGIFNGNSSLTITNCTFSRNLAKGSGGGISNYWDSNITLTNCILWGDIPDEIQVADGTVNVNYCDVQGEYSFTGTGNINIDPLFADTENNDYHLQSSTGRLNPVRSRWIVDLSTSPCIDAGDPNSDWTAEPLPNANRINMGAYGGTEQASKSPAN
ncbi:right-handed parallel beta-helix repeat-containing protein, partial [Planctomycetota bacterium]